MNFDPKKDIDVSLADQFAGKWEWSSGEKSINLILTRQQGGDFPNFLMGWYSYTVNGKTIINQLDKLGDLKSSGLGGTILLGNDSVNITFTDETRHQLRHGTINFADQKHNKILLKYKYQRFIQSSDHMSLKRNIKQYGESEKLPENLNIILTRVK